MLVSFSSCKNKKSVVYYLEFLTPILYCTYHRFFVHLYLQGLGILEILLQLSDVDGRHSAGPDGVDLVAVRLGQLVEDIVPVVALLLSLAALQRLHLEVRLFPPSCHLRTLLHFALHSHSMNHRTTNIYSSTDTPARRGTLKVSNNVGQDRD